MTIQTPLVTLVTYGSRWELVGHAVDFYGILWYLGYGGPPEGVDINCIHSPKHMRREFGNRGGGQMYNISNTNGVYPDITYRQRSWIRYE